MTPLTSSLGGSGFGVNCLRLSREKLSNNPTRLAAALSTMYSFASDGSLARLGNVSRTPYGSKIGTVFSENTVVIYRSSGATSSAKNHNPDQRIFQRRRDNLEYLRHASPSFPPSRRWCGTAQESSAFTRVVPSFPGRSFSSGAVPGQAVVMQESAPVTEHYEDEFASREAVLKYLKSEKIETTELETIALPPSVEVMSERVAFLKKIGLTTKDINEYPLMVGCSVKKNLVPVLSYLEKLNVESKFLPDLIRKYPMVLNSSVTMDLEPVVSFLLGIGIERLNLGRVLTRYPEILGFKIEGTMSTSVAYLVSLGVNVREIGPMITEYPEILGMRVGNNIKPKVDYLIGLGIPKKVLAKVLEVKPFILGFDLERKMKAAVQDLLALGVRENCISGVLVQYADVLGLDLKLRMESKLGWLTKHAGIKKEDIGQLVEKLPQILAINIALAQARVNFLKNEGFPVEQIGTMVTGCPQILALSVDKVLKPNLSFFTQRMRRPLTDLVDYPFYFTHSLEERIKPRYAQIEQKGVNCSLSWFLSCSDAKFAERLSTDFVDRPSEGEIEPTLLMGGRVRVRGDVDLTSDDEVNLAAES